MLLVNGSMARCRERCVKNMVVVAALVLVLPCLGFQPATSASSLRRQGLAFDDACSSSGSGSSSSRSRRRRSVTPLATTRLGAKKSKEDLMEKILPLIESVTTSRDMVPSDLTRGYDGYVFPGPLTTAEVSIGKRRCRVAGLPCAVDEKTVVPRV